jgi:hypothetical protein
MYQLVEPSLTIDLEPYPSVMDAVVVPLIRLLVSLGMIVIGFDCDAFPVESNIT